MNKKKLDGDHSTVAYNCSDTPIALLSPRCIDITADWTEAVKGTSLAWVGRCSDTAGDDSGILGFPFSLRPTSGKETSRRRWRPVPLPHQLALPRALTSA